MFVIAVIDFETMYVYNVHILIFGILLAAFLYVNNILQIELLSFISAFIPPFFKISYEYARQKVTKNKVTVIGWGDVYIFIILFFLLDFLNIAIIIFISGLFGVFFGILRKSEYSNHYPFIPSISLAVYTIFIWKFL
jgi:prepilin signal peptidase PulO-like enzyme (type II secretory pathway)